MMKVLITGAAGFIGGFLAKYCLKTRCSVLGLGVELPKDGWPTTEAAAFERCDMRDAGRLSRLIKTFRPERIFHLAARSHPTVSLSRARETMDINAGGTINLFECLRQADVAPVTVVACSSAEYGSVASGDLPVQETHPLRPLHPYGVSKVAQDLLAAQYFTNYAIPCLRIRIFNTTGPGKIGDVCSDLTKRAVEIELGNHPPSLAVGNIASRRAIIDVRDMVRALWLSAERCEAGQAYNVGATDVYSVQELVETIRSLVKVPFDLHQEPKLVRSCDEQAIVGDITKFQDRTGWKPEIRLAGTLQEMLDWWRSQLGHKPIPEPHLADTDPIIV